MQFPKCLIKNNRKDLPENKIKNKHYLFARHKPGREWLIGDEYPDFTKIKSDQSFNWSAFSIPIWVRFNDQMTYLDGYGVVGYSVFTIRKAHKINTGLPENMYGVKHNSLVFNYSHCTLYPINASNQTKRDFRMSLKHKCQKKIYPNSNRPWFKNTFDRLIMFYHRILLIV
jgi:hypothetical protein